MLNIKKILLAVDGPEPSMRAAEDAAELAVLTGAKIILLTAYPDFVTTSAEPYFAQAHEALKFYEAMLRDRGVKTESVVYDETAAEAICRVARDESCDLIVMGSRGLGKVMGILLGSVAKAVVRDAPCSVWVVR